MTLLRSEIGQLTDRTQLRSPYAVFLITALIIIVADGLFGSLPYYADLDDQVRMLQLRELLAHGRVLDLTLGFVATPDPVVSHYSRIVDLPYVLIALALKPFLGSEAGLAFAAHIWPPIMLIAYAYLVVVIAGRVAGSALSPTLIVAMGALMAFSILEFSAGRIDHHNIQLLLTMVVIAGLTTGSALGGLWAGVATAASIGVGLECLPYLAAAFGVLTFAAIWRPDRYGAKFGYAGIGLAIAMVPMAILSAGPGGIFGRYCDAVGAPFTLAALLAGCIMVAAPLTWRRGDTDGHHPLAFRLASLIVPAAGAAAVLVYLYPHCLAGHYGAIDDLARQFWLERLQQEKSIVQVLGEVPAGAAVGWYGLSIAFLACIYSTIMLAAVPAQIRAAHEGDINGLIVLAVAAMALALFFVMLRSSRFMVAFAPLLLVGAAQLRQQVRMSTALASARRWLVASAVLPVLVFAGVAVAVEKTEKRFSVFDVVLYDACRGHDLAALSTIEPGHVLAGQALSVRIADADPRFRVAASPLHRSWPGTSAMIAAIMATDLRDRRDVLAPFDYLAICQRSLGVDDLGQAPLFARLLADQSVSGLTPVSPDANSAFRLYRIDHNALR